MREKFIIKMFHPKKGTIEKPVHLNLGIQNFAKTARAYDWTITEFTPVPAGANPADCTTYVPVGSSKS